MFVKELRLRVDDYFRVVIKTLRVTILWFSKLFQRISDTSLLDNLSKKCNMPSTMNF